MSVGRSVRLMIPPPVEFMLRVASVLRSRLGLAPAARAANPRQPNVQPCSPDDLRKIMASLHIVPGDVLMVHSSSEAIGRLGWSPTDMIDFLLEYLGPQGTLAMPSHPRLRKEEGTLVYEPHRSPSTVGIMTELFRRRKGTLRSEHPFSAAVAQGARAEELLRDHQDSYAPHDERSPYGKLKEFGGKVLALGCDLERMTIIHVAEDAMRDEFPIPGFYQTHAILIRKQSSQLVREVRKRSPWLWWYLAKYQWLRNMYSNGFVREHNPGGVMLREVDARPAIEWMEQAVTRGATIYPLARANRFLHLTGGPDGEGSGGN